MHAPCPGCRRFSQATRAQALSRVQRLRRIAGITVFDDAPGQQGVWPFLLLTLPSEATRDAALNTLWTAGLGVSRLFIHALPDYDYLREIVARYAAAQRTQLRRAFAHHHQ